MTKGFITYRHLWNLKMEMDEYYKHYLTLHQNKWCRRFHFVGQLATISYVCLIVGLNMKLWSLLLAPFVIYPFAWSGHFLFEKNKPAAFSDPVKAKISDWIMFKDMLTGRIKL